MSWTDQMAIEQILKLKKEFKINTAIATGTYKGNDVMLYAQYFNEVYSMDVSDEYLTIARERLKGYDNIVIGRMPSDEFLRGFKCAYDICDSDDVIYFYLDAHFYNPKAKPEDRWVVVKELQALEDFPNCVIAIHDFDNGELGHLIYDGEHMGWNVVGEYIQKVNPNFYYYTNTKGYCDIYNEETIKQSSILVDEHTLDNLHYANSSDIKKYRGILYAVPRELDLNKYELVEF